MMDDALMFDLVVLVASIALSELAHRRIAFLYREEEKRLFAAEIAAAKAAVDLLRRRDG